MLVGGLVGYGVYKMSSSDAERIEEHTGVDPEEMTDEELAQSMDELGIEKQQITDADREGGGGTPSEAAAPPPAAPAGRSSGLDELEQLAKLHEEGILTDEEFTAKKKQILGL